MTTGVTDIKSSLGTSPERVEDAALLTGNAVFFDDMPTPLNAGHMAILRASEAHARISSIDIEKASALPGVHCILTSQDIIGISLPLMAGIKMEMDCWPMAVEKIRYVGEPVALVVAKSRYVAEDALDLIDVVYESLPPVINPKNALQSESLLHEAVGSNLVSDRQFSYGEPELAFDEADHEISISVEYPRNAVTPIECYGVLAVYDAHENRFDVTANFQGPFSIHAVLAKALMVDGNQLRLRTPPNSGGSFGVKQGVFPYIVLAGLASRVAGRPVKWVEDRLEHLMASVSATNRSSTLRAAVSKDGRITALDWDQLEDVGAYLRAPEPATLYRMHGNMTGAYDIQNVSIRNRVVVTNKTPTGLVRGFGGPQVYFALERLIAVIANQLNLDPLDVIRCNLIGAEKFPFKTATGAIYDSGDYAAVLGKGLKQGKYQDLINRRDAARSEGKLYGIGFAAVVEPSVSNMGYVSTVLSAEQRARSGPKNGALATATVSLDPLGGVNVHASSVPQGQGHRTVLGQVVGDVLGLEPSRVSVITELDTARDAWSIASGNYASRFAAAVAGAAHLGAIRLRDKLAKIAAGQLNVDVDDVAFSGGKVLSVLNPDNALPFSRVASASHWAPATVGNESDLALRETVFWTPPELEAPTSDDRVNSSLCHGFIFDMCGVEIDRFTGSVRIDRYVSAHDCGKILHPAMVDGQIRGGFSNAVGAALYEEYSYSEDGNFLSGTFADYLVPSAAEIPDLQIVHMETPSPFTVLGAKGVGEGNCMSTPVTLANAVSDALSKSVICLPMTPVRIRAMLGDTEPPAPKGIKINSTAKKGSGLSGEGAITIRAPRQLLWDALLDSDTLKQIVPGCHVVNKLSDTHFKAEVTLGVGPVKGHYVVDIELSDLDPPNYAKLSGSARGALGSGQGHGNVRLEENEAGETTLYYDYVASVGGKVAAVGSRLLDGATKIVISQFFKALANHATGESDNKSGVITRILSMFGLGGAK